MGGEEIPELPSDQVIEGVTFTVTQEGVRQALLVADTAYMHQDSSVVDLVGMDLRVFDEAGRENAHVTSATGVLNTRTQAMTARGNARLVTSDGSTITTEELHYDPAGNRIWSDMPTVMVQRGGTRVEGTGFTSDPEFRNYRIQGARTQGGAVRF
ncbi:MAG TPA: LPS export ABC transporter periplasmic protein LptC, partial [Longimicrobiales bacterium]|nr:LPS export ABC transporter periplasmic protein LptC [Longimicrobiales bacterium]